MSTPTLAALLAQARALGVDRLDAQLLIGHVLQRPRSWVIAHDDAVPDAAQAAALAEALRQRAAGVPLAYLLGEKDFHGLALQVGPGVLVPRPDTETLVDWALALLAEARLPAPEVADLGTGSGAIALALAHRWPAARVTATDRSATALAIAQANAERLALPVRFAQGDWWQPLAGQRFDLLVSNPPYIAGDDPHLATLTHEPREALTPEGDGLAALRTLAAGAPVHLRRSGWLLLEHGWDQGAAVREMLAAAGFADVQTRRDLEGRERCTGGCWR